MTLFAATAVRFKTMPVSRPSHVWLWMPAVLGFLAPSLTIVCMDVVLRRSSLLEAIENVGARQFAEGDNLFLLAGLGLVPFVLLAIILILPFRNEQQAARVPWLSVAGTVGALAFMIPAHVSVWLPLYTDARMSSTAVIAFLFIPVLCCVTMALGLLVGVFTTRARTA